MWLKILLVVTAFVGSEGFGKLIPGGERVLTTEEIKSDKVLQDLDNILIQVANMYNRKSNSMYAYRITETVKITKRVVAGIEYGITLQFTPTECKKSKEKFTKEDLMSCKLSEVNGRPKTCRFTAWYRPWLILGAPMPLKIDMRECR